LTAERTGGPPAASFPRAGRCLLRSGTSGRTRQHPNILRGVLTFTAKDLEKLKKAI
jgi:hypothetical protein